MRSEASLKKQYLINARLCHQLTGELLRLLDIFEANRIPAIQYISNI
jgi:hypothetical protein